MWLARTRRGVPRCLTAVEHSLKASLQCPTPGLQVVDGVFLHVHSVYSPIAIRLCHRHLLLQQVDVQLVVAGAVAPANAAVLRATNTLERLRCRVVR